MLEHHGYAVLYRIVTATASAMKPCMRDRVGTGNHRVMANRANQDL